MRKYLMIAIMATLIAPLPEGEAEPVLTVLKKYRLRHEITDKRHVGDFGLMPEAGGFYRGYRLGTIRDLRDHDKPSQYLQVNDKIYGPYDHIRGEIYRPGGKYSFILWRKVYPARCCYTIGSQCSLPFAFFTIFPGCFLGHLYRPFDYLLNKEQGVFRNEGYGTFVMINGRPYGPYDAVSNLSFARTGDSFAFKYVQKGRDYFMLNGKVINPFQNRYDNKSVMSDDGMHHHDGESEDMGYVVSDGGTHGGSVGMFTSPSMEKGRGGYYVRRGSGRWGPFDRVGRLVSSGDGKNFGFDYVKKDDYYVHVNGKNYGPYEMAGSPGLAENRPAFWFYFTKGDKEHYYINGKNYGPFRDSRITTSRNLENFGIVYKCKDGGRCVVIQGREYGPFDALDVTLHFSSDGSRWAVIYNKFVGSWHHGRDDWRIRFMEKDFGPYEAADFQFTSDDRAIAGYIENGHAFVAEIR